MPRTPRCSSMPRGARAGELTEADRSYLRELEAWLDMYPEMRPSEG
jgi:hypothetical protein